MFTSLKYKLSSPHLRERILTGFALMVALFLGVTLLSYWLLPEGILRGKNPAQSWEESSNNVTLFAQIFFFNLISVIVITLGSLFAIRPNTEHHYFSTGWLVLYTLISIYAVTLGPWSFSVERETPTILNRIIGILNVAELSVICVTVGQLFITAALARIAIMRTTGQKIENTKLGDTRLTRPELLVLLAGIPLMLISAAIEAVVIHTGYSYFARFSGGISSSIS